MSEKQYPKKAYDMSVEVGHVYAPGLGTLLRALEDAPTSEPVPAPDQTSWEKATEMQRYAAAMALSQKAVRMVLVDEVVARFDMDRLTDRDGLPRLHDALWLGRLVLPDLRATVDMSVVDDIMLESNFVPAGRNIIDDLRSREADKSLPVGYRSSQDGSRMIVGSGDERHRIRLEGFADLEDKTHPSCKVLDLATLERRAYYADKAITVLPAGVGFELEQLEVEALAIALPEKLPHEITSVFVDPDTLAEVERFEWRHNQV